MATGFLIFLLLFAAVGISSTLKSKNTKEDYYLAGHSVAPWLVGLSAVATNNSGYMFIGVIGYTYTTGLASVWLMVGWLVGDLLGSLMVHKRLRKAVGQSGQPTFAGAMSHWFGNRYRAWQLLAAVISLVFMLSYAGAQLVAGSKALFVLLHWPQWTGAVIGAVIVALYCMAGGLRASIWTDAAQSMVMIVAMGLLLYIAVQNGGGYGAVVDSMSQVEGFLDLYPKDMVIPGVGGLVLFIVGWLFAGLSVIGQPHIMIRFMALNNADHMIRARLWYYLWFAAFYMMATGVGMLSRLYFPEARSFDAELALPMMAEQLLPGPLAGLILAGIFAATMSTADSLLLGCSSAMTHDILPHRIEKTWLLRSFTVAITLIALVWALLNKQSVFSLVIMSWSGLSSAFGGVLLVLVAGGRPSQRTMIAMTVTGLAVAIGWRLAGLHASIYEGFPGILSALLLYLVIGAMDRARRSAAASNH